MIWVLIILKVGGLEPILLILNFFKKLKKLNNSTLTAFGMTKKPEEVQKMILDFPP